MHQSSLMAQVLSALPQEELQKEVGISRQSEWNPQTFFFWLKTLRWTNLQSYMHEEGVWILHIIVVIYYSSTVSSSCACSSWSHGCHVRWRLDAELLSDSAVRSTVVLHQECTIVSWVRKDVVRAAPGESVSETLIIISMMYILVFGLKHSGGYRSSFSLTTQCRQT